MRLTYKEFMNAIPEETKEYLKTVFKFLDYYSDTKIKRTTTIYKSLEDCYSLTNPQIYQAKLLLSTFIGLLKQQKTSTVVCKHNFDGSNVMLFYGSNVMIENNLIPLTEAEEKEMFDKYNELFCFHNDYTKYSTLLPIDIAANALKISSKELQNKLFSFFEIDSKLCDTIKQLSIDEHTNKDTEKELTIYENIPYDTINYIETASKIRTILINNLSKTLLEENEYLKKDDNYLVPLSLLLAVYEYDKTEKNTIENYLTSNGIKLNEIYNKIRINPTYEIQSTPRNMESIELIYKKYWTEGKNKDKPNKDINIVNIINNLFDRNFTNSIIIEKILNDFKKEINDFSNIEEEIEIYKNLYEESHLDQEVKNFYSKIRKDTQEFINFSCKSYQVLLKKVKSGKYNHEILTKKEDIENLAVYISSHFYQTDIDSFYDLHGVTFEKIIKLLNIEITKEEIETELLDKSILLEKFKKFVINGINYSKNSEYITVNDVSLNLCNRDFNKSMIMENIFEEIRRDINLPNDFFNMLDNFISNQKKEIKHKEKEEYFKNLPIEDLTYLTNVCRAYKGLTIKTNAKDKYCDDLIIVLSLLIGIDNLKDNKTQELLKSIGISFESIYSHFIINNVTDGELDIQLLKTKFNKYIYEGRNKGNNSPTIQDIALNIFNDELYKSTELTEYLFKCGLNYEIFKDSKKLIQKFEEKIEEDKKNDEQIRQNLIAKEILYHCPQSIISLTERAVKIYDKLMKIYQKDKNKYEEISSEEDIEILSIILSILESNIDKTKTFLKHGLNMQDILEFLGIPINHYNNETTEYNENTLANVFIKYIKKDTLSIADLIKSEFYQKIINKFVKNVVIFEKELITGKNYEETLTLLERIELIKSSPLETLDLTNMTEVLKFGSSLDLHTAYIQDEYPKLIQSDEVKIATQEIKKLVDSAYTQVEIKEEPKGFFQKLLGVEPTIRNEVRINTDIIKSLKPNIEIQITKLYTEAQKLTELKEYMEQYYKKNKEYIKILEKNLVELNKQLQEISNEDIFKIYNLKSYINILENKRKTLKLTAALIQQEYIKINQVIVNHCITIESLLMSRNTLLPLIGTEMLIESGINTEKESIDVTKNILTLLNDLISKDITGTKEVLEKLKSTSLSEEQLLLITKSTNDQINQINSAKLLEYQTETNHLTLEVTSSENFTNNNTINDPGKKMKKIY